ncbi:MAG TPA: MFS transporter [Bacillota bacterium]|nr:MFS transporter [Bacillota bacterium]
MRGGAASGTEEGSGGRNGGFGVLVVCSLCFFLANVHRISPGVFAAELMREFDASASVMGLLSSSYFYTYAILQVPVGILCDRFRPGLVMGIFMTIGAAGSVIFAMSGSLAMAIVGRVILTAGISAVFIGAMRLFGYAYGSSGASFATGIMVAVGNVGGMSASGPLAYAVVNYGWRASMIAIGVLTLAAGTASMAVTKSYGRKSRPDCIQEEDGLSLKQGRKDYLGMLAVLSLAVLAQYGSQMGFQGLWGVPFMTDVYGITKTAAGNIMMLASLGAAIGAPLIGWLVGRKGVSAHMLALVSASIFFLSWFAIVKKWDASDLTLLGIGSFFLAGGSSFTSVLNPYFCQRYVASGSRGLFFGMLNTAPMIGGALYQPLMGYMIDRYFSAGKGLENGYFAAFRLGLASAAAVLALRILYHAKYSKMKGLPATGAGEMPQ